MLTNFLTLTQQVAVLFILIAIGLICKKTRLIGDSAVKGMTNLVLYFATPCIIINSFQHCKFNREMLLNLLLTVVVVLCIYLASIFLCIFTFRDKDMKRRSVLRVGTIFSNCGFMSLPLQQAILGNDGVFYGAIYVAMFNLFVWTYGLVAMSGNKNDLSVRKMITNPGLIGVTLAILLWALNIHLPEIISKPLDYMGALNTPVPMVIIGCHLANAKLKKAFTHKFAYLSMFFRLVAIPLASLLVLYLCGIRGSMLVAIIIATSAPAAATTTMFSTKFDRDTSLSVGLVSATTLLSIITMPLVVALAQNFA